MSKLNLVVVLTTVQSLFGRHEPDTPSRFFEMSATDFDLASTAGYVREATDEERAEFEGLRAAADKAAEVAEGSNETAQAEIPSDTAATPPRGSKRKT